jgi:NAD(P)-dependent dehydrogenase (short-subunit alcohol dehydrogenase family)
VAEGAGLLRLRRRCPYPRIVNVLQRSGLASQHGRPGRPVYQVSNAALNPLTRTLAGELRAERILVNGVWPAWTATDMAGRGAAIQ